jgi:hypothetical protein
VRRAVILVLASCAAVVGCHGPPGQVTDAAPDAPAAEIAPDVQPDAAACECRVDDTDTLELAWACYCQLPFVGCDAPLSVPAECAQRSRTDYADCGLTVITQSTGASAGLPTVYDATGTLVGRVSHSETSVYQCPSAPNVWGSNIRAGRFPAATCSGVACGGCYAGAFPCTGADAGTP